MIITLVTSFKGKAFNISPLSIIFAADLCVVNILITLRIIPSIPALPQVLIIMDDQFYQRMFVSI